MDVKYKQCRLSVAAHKKLRLLGAEHDLTITQVIDMLIKASEVKKVEEAKRAEQ